jgi:pre-rRNA-processing protein IPI1
MPPKPPPDFKKIKAKVGKRAPKQLNLTETSFRAASLSLREQAVQVEKHNDALISSRGRSISELSTQLQHPARAVRISAAKGLRDILSHIQDNSSVRQNVSLWVNICSKCLVDEEDEVRTLSLAMLKHLLLQLANSNDLIPLSGFIIAFVSSTLNSLDKSTRRDGAEAVALLSRYVPHLVRPYISTKLLPAFVRILVDYRVTAQRTSQQPANDASKSNQKTKKRKRNTATAKTTSTNGQQSMILEALLFLLEAAVGKEDEDEDCLTVPKRYRMTLEHTPISTNSLFLSKSNTRHRVGPVTSFRKLLHSTGSMEGDDAFATSSTQHQSISLDFAKEFILKLRDKFVEVTQKGFMFNDEAYRLSWEDLQIAYRLLRCMNLFWKTYGKSIASRLVTGGEEAVRFKKQCGQLLHLILEHFPLYDDGSPNSKAKNANFEVCSTVLCMCTSLRGVWEDQKVSTSIKQVTNYVHSQLEMRLNDTDNTESSQDIVSTPTIQVISILLIDGESLWGAGKAVFDQLRTLFHSAFFSDKEMFNENTARSKVGRAAAILAIALIEQSSVSGDFDMTYPSETSKTIEIFPRYLNAWKGDFERESFSVLSFLLQIAQQSGNVGSPLLHSIRQSVEPLFVDSHTPNGNSIFETMSPTVQHLAISLTLALGPPTELIIKGLASSCARCLHKSDGPLLSPEFAAFIVWSIHCSRKTIRMQSYICFLVDSTGLLEIGNEKWWDDNKPDHVVKSEMLQALDSALANVVTCLMQCGSKKVLPTLHTLLSKLMEPGDLSCKTSKAVWIRAAVSFLAAFSMDIARDDSSVTLTRLLPEHMVELLMAALERFFQHSRQQQLTNIESWIKPFFVLFASESELFNSFFHSQFVRLGTMDSTEQAKTIDMIHNLLQNDMMMERVHADADNLLKVLQAVCLSMSGSRLDKRSECLIKYLQNRKASFSA